MDTWPTDDDYGISNPAIRTIDNLEIRLRGEPMATLCLAEASRSPNTVTDETTRTQGVPEIANVTDPPRRTLIGRYARLLDVPPAAFSSADVTVAGPNLENDRSGTPGFVDVWCLFLDGLVHCSVIPEIGPPNPVGYATTRRSRYPEPVSTQMCDTLGTW